MNQEITLIAEAIIHLEKNLGKLPQEIIKTRLVEPLVKLEKITINDIREVLEKNFGMSYNVI